MFCCGVGFLSFLFVEYAHVILFQVFVFIRFDASAANKDKEQTACREPTKHNPAPDLFGVANKEHRGDEKAENTFAKYCFQKLEVLHNKVELAEGHDHQKAEQSKKFPTQSATILPHTYIS